MTTIKNASKTNSDKLPLVKLLSTGGTIAMKFDSSKKGYVAALKGKNLVDTIPEISELANIDVEDIFTVNSSSMTTDHWVKLSNRINEILEDPDVTGVIVTHGTDTMEETAYFLDLTITSSKPVIVTGAQKAASHPDSDGPTNLINAIRVATCEEANGKGVLIVMNGQISAAREVTKTNTVSVASFNSFEFGLLGYADPEKVRFYRAPVRRQTIPLNPDTQLGRVDIVLHYAGNDGSLIRGLMNEVQLGGLVVAGTGLGHVGQAQFKVIEDVCDRGIPVVISTRVPSGRVMALYSSPGSGVALSDIGCIRADNLSPWKARILLILAMSKTNNIKELQKYFDH